MKIKIQFLFHFAIPNKWSCALVTLGVVNIYVDWTNMFAWCISIGRWPSYVRARVIDQAAVCSSGCGQWACDNTVCCSTYIPSAVWMTRSIRTVRGRRRVRATHSRIDSLPRHAAPLSSRCYCTAKLDLLAACTGWHNSLHTFKLLNNVKITVRSRKPEIS